MSERLLPGIAAPDPNRSTVRLLPTASVQVGLDSAANSSVYQMAFSPAKTSSVPGLLRPLTVELSHSRTSCNAPWQYDGQTPALALRHGRV